MERVAASGEGGRNNREKKRNWRAGESKGALETEQQIEGSGGEAAEEELDQRGYRGYPKTVVYLFIISRRRGVTVDNRTRSIPSCNSREPGRLLYTLRNLHSGQAVNNWT